MRFAILSDIGQYTFLKLLNLLTDEVKVTSWKKSCLC